jgi:hypothetical protein
MFKPYICVACERVILEKPSDFDSPDSEGVASLIGLFSKMIAIKADDQVIPANAVIPKEWAIFSAWDIESGDAGKKCNICTQIRYPDGSPFGETSKIPLKLEMHKRSQNVVKIVGFPVGQIGLYSVQTWIEENDVRVSEPVEFKIEFEIRKPSKPQVPSETTKAI